VEGQRDRSGNEEFWCFVVPFTLFIEIPIVGRMFLSELVLFCLLPGLLASRGNLLRERLPKRMLAFGAIWLVMQVYTDVTHATAFEDWSRGWSKIIFFLINFSAIYLLLDGSRRRMMLFAAGLAVGGIAQYFFSPSIYAGEFPWKFGLGGPITLLLALLAQSERTPRGRALLLLALACGANLMFGFRSMAAFCFVTVVFVLGQERARRVKFHTLVLAFTATAYAMSQLYGCLASEGVLGDDAKQKYEMQSAGEFGLVLGARVELFASTQAVIDSPLIGHGSWAKDFKYVDVLNERLADFGYELTTDPDNELVPSHSYFMGAWVESGIAGALFWLWIFVVVLGAFRSSLIDGGGVPILAVFLGTQLVWNIFLSPFGAEARIQAAYMIALMMFTTRGPVGRQSGDKLGSLLHSARTL
jgi:hypothetical protein